MDPFVNARPRIVISVKPTLLIMNVESEPVSEAADPTTMPSKSTWRGFIVMKGAVEILMPVSVIGC